MMIILLLVASSAALDVRLATASRRAVLLGAMSSLPALAVVDPSDEKVILERAEEGTLQAPAVLMRARSDSMVIPADAADCKQLANLLSTDQEALYELLPAARQYVKFVELTAGDPGEMSGAPASAVLNKMLKDADLAEGRIGKQLDAIKAERTKRKCPAP